MPDVHTDRILLLDALALDGEQSTLALATRLGAHKPHVLTDLQALERAGLVVRRWDGGCTLWRRVGAGREAA